MPKENRNLRIRKSTLAKYDLFEIWFYSFSQWGSKQADIYLDDLEEGLTKLSKAPYLGKVIETKYKIFHRLKINHHLIYYSIQKDCINVIRILHEKQSEETIE